MSNEKINDTNNYNSKKINYTKKENKISEDNSYFKKQICIKTFDYMFF